MIRLASPDITQAEIDAVAEVMRSGYLVQSENVRLFEEALAKVSGTGDAVAVNSCTTALYLALKSLGLAAGSEVAVPCYSWPATANVVELAGLQPVFVDIDPRTFNMDPKRLDETLQSHPQIKAVIVVHAFGGMSAMDKISALCSERRLPLIEDAACALGASFQNRSAGQWGTLACFSFHPRKAITTGEGGAVVGNDPARLLEVRMLRNHGLDPSAQKPDFVVPGHNFRLTEMQAAMGRVQLRRMDGILSRRAQQVERYNRLFAGTEILVPHIAPHSNHVFQSYVVSLPQGAVNRRDSMIAKMKDAGIETTIGTQHIPMTSFYRKKYDFRPGDFPGCDIAAAGTITLPLHSALTEEEQAKVVKKLTELL